MSIVVSTVAVAPDPSDSGQFMVVADPTLFPDPDVEGPFSVYVYATGGLATYTTAETATIVSRNVAGWVLRRAQEGTAARLIVVGDVVQLVPTRLAAILDANTSDVQIVNSAADTIVYSYVVPGGLLGTKGALRVDLSAKFNNDTGVSRALSFKVTYGGVTSYLDPLTISTDAGGFRAVDIHFTFGNNGATNKQKLSGMFAMGADPGPTTGIGALGGLSGAYPFVGVDPGRDSTADQTLAVWAKLAVADSSLEFTKLLGYTTRVAY